MLEDRGGDYVRVRLEIYVRTDWAAKNVAGWFNSMVEDEVVEVAGTVAFPYVHATDATAERVRFEDLPKAARTEVLELEEEDRLSELEVEEEGATGIEIEDVGGPFGVNTTPTEE